jgi:hypothetical protein
MGSSQPVIAGLDGCYGSREAKRHGLRSGDAAQPGIARDGAAITPDHGPSTLEEVSTGVLVTTGWRVWLIDGCPVTATAPATSRP